MEWLPYSSNSVAEKIKNFAKQKRISVRKMLSEIGLSSTIIVNMKNSMPKADNLARIADYLDCSVDYLLGRVGAPGEYVNLEKGEHPPVLSSTAAAPAPQTQTMVFLFEKMDNIDQDFILQKSIEVLNSPKYKKGGGLFAVQKM